MSCNCNEQPRKNLNTWGCGCNKMPQEPIGRRGVVQFCDICDPCKQSGSNVRLCAFVVPTLEDGRFYRNSFIFVQEDDSTYYISDDKSEIPFGSRPKFIDDFNPDDPAIKYKSTVVYDVKNKKGYIYDPEGNRMDVDFVGGSQEKHLTVDYSAATWETPTTPGPAARVTTPEIIYESVLSNVKFTDENNSEYTAAQLFELLEGGTKVVLDNVPLGWYYDSTTPDYQINPDFVADSVQFDQVTRYISSGAECSDPKAYHGSAYVSGVEYEVSLEKTCNGDGPVYLFSVQGYGAMVH